MARFSRFNIIISILLIAVCLAAFAAYTAYNWVQSDNIYVNENTPIYLSTGSNFNDLRQKLRESHILKNEKSFEWVASWMNFGDEQVKPGRYLINPAWSNRQLINQLRTGRQAPIKVILNNARDLPEIAGKLARNLEIDSADLERYLLDQNIQETLGFKKEELPSLFIPNTYELFWNINIPTLIKRMQDEHNRFWQMNNRLQKAQALNLSPIEVYTLASIVEKETQAKSERPTVAGLYLNRLERSIPLQADPTVVFAVGDFNIRRVLNKHLETKSPYNTYLHAGLPPGPIYMPSISSIDAVLNPEKHKYLYMCAKPDNSGLHAFASSLAGHNANANRYRKWLNQRGIK